MSISLSTFVFSSPSEDYNLSAKSFLNQEVSKYGNVQFGELPILLAAIRSISLIHQQNHWISKGKSFYGDHLLFMRLYEETDKIVDVIAEKTVGLAESSFVLLAPQLTHIANLVNILNDSLSQENPCETSYQAVLFLNSLTTEIFNRLETSRLLTPGLEQTIGTILETIESHMYLLKQRYIK